MKALPSVPQCPGAQTKRTLLKIANDFNAFIASATRPVVALKAETALMAAKLSQHIAIRNCYSCSQDYPALRNIAEHKLQPGRQRYVDQEVE